MAHTAEGLTPFHWRLLLGQLIREQGIYDQPVKYWVLGGSKNPIQIEGHHELLTSWYAPLMCWSGPKCPEPVCNKI